MKTRSITHYKIDTDGCELDVYPAGDGVSVLIDGDEDGGLYLSADEAHALAEALQEVALSLDAEKAGDA